MVDPGATDGGPAGQQGAGEMGGQLIGAELTRQVGSGHHRVGEVGLTERRQVQVLHQRDLVRGRSGQVRLGPPSEKPGEREVRSGQTGSSISETW